MKVEIYCPECFRFIEVDVEDLEYIDEFYCQECGNVIDLHVED